MPAMTPEDICRLFQQFMAKGDLDAVMSVYDPEAVFLNQSREVTKSREDLRRELAPLAAAKAAFDFNVKQIIQTGNIALMHTEWKVSRAAADDRVCDRGRSPPSRWNMVLAHRRSLHSWQGSGLLKTHARKQPRPRHNKIGNKDIVSFVEKNLISVE